MKFTKSDHALILSIFIFLGPSLSSVLSAPSVPTDVTILSRKDFIGHNFYSVADALEYLTSLNFQKEGARGSKTTAKMRGRSSDSHTLVLLDGRILNRDSDGEVNLSLVPINIVERIEITRGGSSSAYGAEALGGAIHIVTGRPHAEGLLVDLETAVGRGGVKNSMGRFLGRSNWGDITYLPSKEVSGGFQDLNETEATTNFGKLTRSFNGKGYWGAEYFFQESEAGITNGTPVPFEEWDRHKEKAPSTFLQEQHKESQFAKISLGSPMIRGGTFYLDAAQSWGDQELKNSLTGFVLSDRKNKVQTFDLKYRKKGFEAGGAHFASTDERRGETRRRKFQSGFYLLNKWDSKKWVFQPSFRVDNMSTAETEYNPRLVVIRNFEADWTISGSAQTSFRSPSFEELYFSTDNSHNPNLNSEKLASYDLGFSFHPGDKFKLGSTAFFQELKKGILMDPAGQRLENKGKEESAGAETEMEFHAGEKEGLFKISALLNWTYQRSIRSSGNGGGFVPTQMTPRNLVNFKLIHHMPRKTTLINELRYKSWAYQYDDNQGARLPSYYVWNFRYQKRILAAHVHFAVENILGRRYADDVVYFTNDSGVSSSAMVPQSAQTFWAGISIEFIN